MAVRTGWFARATTPSVLRSALRFTIAVSIADAILFASFGAGTPAVLGSYATIIMLYSLDYPGSMRQRAIGFGVAWVVGLVAVALGALLSQPLWLAVVGSLVVSSVFVFGRVLRGFVAQAAVALQGPFFLALVNKEAVANIPTLLATWTIGSLVAILVGVLLSPRRGKSPIRVALARWLGAAAGVVTQSKVTGKPVSLVDLDAAAGELLTAVRTESMPGAIGYRQRAVAEMAQTAQWAIPAFEVLASSERRTSNDSADRLLDDSGAAFAAAARAVVREPVDSSLPDLVAARSVDLDKMGRESTDDTDRHYRVRLISIIAMRMLWLSGRSIGKSFPQPDIGGHQITAAMLIRANLTRRSIWPATAVRAGLCSAVCVWLVGFLGIQHGLWIVMAALAVSQVTFSGTQNGVSSAKIATGSVAGVLVAGLGPLLGHSHLVFALLLPLTAFAAAVGSHVGPFTSQFLYTPFALVNLATLEWATQRDLEELRLQNIVIGVVVAAVFAVAIFPFGLEKQLRRQADEASAASRRYLQVGTAAVHGDPIAAAGQARSACVKTIVELQSALDVARSLPVLPRQQMEVLIREESAARERLLGGDACVQMARRANADRRYAGLAGALAKWWDEQMSRRLP